MKTITLILGACIFFCLPSFSQNFKKLAQSEVDNRKVTIAREFALKFLTKAKNGEAYQFKNEAIDIIKSQLNEENQKLIYEQIKGQFGDFLSLEYAETWTQGDNQIVRLKGDFVKSNRKPEIRVVLNKSDQIAGFWIKPWSDMLQ